MNDFSRIKKESELNKKRGYSVVKHNDLIQKARYNLTVNQQKIIAYIISLIKPTDKELMMYEISVSDFCELCGIDKKHFYIDIKDIVDDLDDKSFWVETEEKLFKFRWFSEFEYLKKKGKIRIQINSNLKKYLLELYQHYTQYEIYNILAIKGKYAIRFYELFQSYFMTKNAKKTSKTVDLEELKSLLMCENYELYAAFRRRVLEPSLEEINKYTDLTVEYEPIRKNRVIVALEFDIKRKEFPSNYAAYKNTIDKINERNKQVKGQMSLFELQKEEFNNEQ